MPALGILGSGPIATVDDAGTDRAARSSWTLRWWVAGEDRWHRFDTDPAVRGRVVDDLPVVETSLRVPSGDVVATTYAFAGVGGAAEIGSHLSTAARSRSRSRSSSVRPRASSWSTASCSVDRSPDRPHRPPGRGRPSDPDLDELAALVQGATGVVEGPVSGYLALVAPLPHAQAISVAAGSRVRAVTGARGRAGRGGVGDPDRARRPRLGPTDSVRRAPPRAGSRC